MKSPIFGKVSTVQIESCINSKLLSSGYLLDDGECSEASILDKILSSDIQVHTTALARLACSWVSLFLPSLKRDNDSLSSIRGNCERASSA